MDVCICQEYQFNLVSSVQIGENGLVHVLILRFFARLLSLARGGAAALIRIFIRLCLVPSCQMVLRWGVQFVAMNCFFPFTAPESRRNIRFI